MLTETEKHLCRAARFPKGIGHGYGTPTNGYCPIGMVAVHRGAEFEVGPNGEYTAYVFEEGHWRNSRWRQVIIGAQEDVCAWTSYRTVQDFLEAWEKQGTAVFPAEENTLVCH